MAGGGPGREGAGPLLPSRPTAYSSLWKVRVCELCEATLLGCQLSGPTERGSGPGSTSPLAGGERGVVLVGGWRCGRRQLFKAWRGPESAREGLFFLSPSSR